MATNPAVGDPLRVLIVGRSPGVLVDAVAILRSRGYAANATNQFDRVLDDYDVDGLDVVVFGGMVPPDAKEQLRREVTDRNPKVTFVQGLAGIAGLIAAQVEGVAVPESGTEIGYTSDSRSVQLMLEQPSHATVEAFWATSFTPPEPTNTSRIVFDGDLDAGPHTVDLPQAVPSQAAFVSVRVGDVVRAFTVGEMPEAITRLVPSGGDDQRLPKVAAVTTRGDDQR